MAPRLPRQALEPAHLLPGAAHGAGGRERHVHLQPGRHPRQLRAQLVPPEPPQPDGQAGRLPGGPHRAGPGQALPCHAAAQRAGLPHEHRRRAPQRQRHLPVRGHLPAPQHTDQRESPRRALRDRENPGAPHTEPQPPTQTQRPVAGAGHWRHEHTGGCPATAAADLGPGRCLPQGHPRCLCVRERGRASEGGPRCSARLHPGLRGAGLPVAREDAGAPRALCPGTDRVCHHRLPGQAGVPGPQGLGQQLAGSPASEPRGQTRPVAPLTGRLCWPMSCRLSTRSPAGTSPGAASSGGPGGCSGAEPVTPAACGSPRGSPLSTHDLGAAGVPVPAPVPLWGCAWGKEARPGPQARPPEPDGPPRPDCCPVLPHVPLWGRGPVPRPPGCLHVGTQRHWPETPPGIAC